MAISVTYQYWSKRNAAADWKGPYSDITKVPDAKYVKVRVNMSSTQADAVPVLKNMKIEYHNRGSVLFL